MDFLNRSISEFAGQLATSAPVPGGGGASALAGALAVALGSMVGELTVGKKKYAAVERDIRALMVRAETLRQRLLECVEKDAAAFEPLSRAYGIPGDDPARPEIMERCLRDAAAAPLEILDLCCEVISMQGDFAAKGSALVRSDAATGAAICRGALYGAAVNVKVNTKLMEDRTYAERLNEYVDQRVEQFGALADRIFMDVYRRYD